MPKCKVRYCKNHPNRGVQRKGRTFHRFPRCKPELLKVWIAMIGREESWQPRKSAVVCSDHFEDTCFDSTGQTIKLQENAVPTLFKTLPRSDRKKPDVIKFPFKRLRSGKLLDLSVPGAPPRDDNYIIRNGILHREKTPPRDWRSYEQDSFLHEDPTGSSLSASVNSESGLTSSQSEEKEDTSLQDEPLKEKDPVPDKTGNIFHDRSRAPVNLDEIFKKQKRINKVKLHDHTYSIGDNPVVLKNKMDVACAKMAELRSHLHYSQTKNRRLSKRVEALTKNVDDLRNQQAVIKKTLKFLNSLKYRPKFDELFQLQPQ